MKKEVKLLGLSYSQTQVGSYVIVLSEVEGDKKLPIIIKPYEAQYIALKMEDIETSRPLTQDLFKQFTDVLGADVAEVYIHTLLEGLFYTKVILTNAMDSYEIECSIGDAVSMAMLYKCPIFASKQVLDGAGIQMDENGYISDEQQKENHKPRESKDPVTIESLEAMLLKAVANEEYEIASQLRDRIGQLKK